MKFVTRQQWGARAPKSRSTNIKPTFGVTLHWKGADVPELLNHSECDDEVRSVQKYHMDSRGWADIAYSAVVCRHGYVYEGRWVGIRSAANHTSQANYDSYAVCYLGDGTPEITAEGAAGMRDAVNALRSRGAGKGVRSHSDVVATACPGDKIRGLIKSGYFIPTTPSPVPPSDNYAHKTISRGSTGPDVRHLQTMLKQWGAEVGVDGDFGPNTHHWTLQFQRTFKLTADGLVGPNTWKKLHDVT